ncbi:class I SAM-dependent DNA methyltransferase, partial [bacterium]
LIGPDFFEHQQMSFIDEEEIFRVNAFDWKTEFSDIMKDGGFDAVIGNPPYVRQEGLSDFKPYFEKQYSVYNGVADLYVYFIEKGVSLIKSGGFFSYIVANKWFRSNYGKPLRQWMKQQHLIEIIDFGDMPVFKQATTYPCILVIQNKIPAKTFRAAVIKTLDFPDLQAHVSKHCYDVQQDALDESGWSLVNRSTQDVLDKISKVGIPLGEYVNGKIYRGVLTGLNEAFVIDNATRGKLIADDPKSAEVIKPFLAGRDIKRYMPLYSEKYLILFPRGFTKMKSADTGRQWDWMRKTYPAIAAHLEPFKEKAEKRYDKGDYWWELRTCDYYAEFEKPKIIVPAIVKSASYSYDTDGFYSNDKTTIIPTTDKYLLGLVGSKTLDYYMHFISSTKQGGYFEYKPMYISKLPIRTINFNDPADVARHDQMVSIVDQMLELNKKLAESKMPQTTEMLSRQIESTDRQIDQLVYELYDLTEEEIRIVESES